MASTVDTREGEVAVGLDLADLLANVLVVNDLEGLKFLGREFLLTRPLKGI